MTTQIQIVAQAIKAMTFDEVMEFADAISKWTYTDDIGNELEEPTISRERAAVSLSDWAEENLPEEEESAT